MDLERVKFFLSRSRLVLETTRQVKLRLCEVELTNESECMSELIGSDVAVRFTVVDDHVGELTLLIIQVSIHEVGSMNTTALTHLGSAEYVHCQT